MKVVRPDGLVFVTVELAPFFKITGVADLLRSILAESARRGLKVAVICPDFGHPYPGLTTKESFSLYAAFDGASASLPFTHAEDSNGIQYFILRDEKFGEYLRGLPSEQLGESAGRLWLKFCYAAFLLLDGLVNNELDFAAERLAVHAFHWQAGPLLGLIKHSRLSKPVRTVLTVDILDMQGRFEPEVVEAHEVYHFLRPQEAPEVNFLRIGIESADMLHTVSPTYAQEIQRPPLGRGLEEIIKQRFRQGRLQGILNGLDTDLTDWRCIPVLRENNLCVAPDQTDVQEHKRRAKLLFQRAAGLPQDPNSFLITMGHRFVSQKNFALVAKAMDGLMSLDPRPQIYLRAWPEPQPASSEFALWWNLVRLSRRYRYHLAFLSPFDRDSSLIEEGIFIDRFLYYAASDLFLMPSLWEPCGLCQLEAMSFGAVPVVTAVGGLVDTVKPYRAGQGGWGFRLVDSYDPEGLIQAVREAQDLWANQHEEWLGMVRRAMAFDSSIKTTMGLYLDRLYAFPSNP